MNIHDFDYPLPSALIAQSPVYPRESAKLMVLNRKTKTIQHYHVSDIPNFFRNGDVVVINNTKVFHARLRSANVELFLIRPVEKNIWLAMGRKLRPGMRIAFSSDFIAEIINKHPDGTVHVLFNTDKVIDYANKYGEVPVPPYIKKIPIDSDYQTSFAKVEGSVAAPTAGFHLTKNIRTALKQGGVEILEITLHVGLGTFLPIKSASVEDHTMHSEWVEISPAVSEKIKTAKKEQRRIVAIGTTTTRALEGTRGAAFQGDVNLFIQPGYAFSVVDVLFTNFHLPKSTLLILVSAFSNREFILKAYQEAIEHNYRFYSFGDAMLIQ